MSDPRSGHSLCRTGSSTGSVGKATELHLTRHSRPAGSDFPVCHATMEQSESRLEVEEDQDGPTVSAKSTRGSAFAVPGHALALAQALSQTTWHEESRFSSPSLRSFNSK